MHCALCGEDRKLIEAHVIPRSFHRIDTEAKRPHRLATNVPGRYGQTIPKGVYDSCIVCEECERRFSPWDDYATELFIQDWKSFSRTRYTNDLVIISLPAYDYARLKLFFLSILWRAAVSKHPMYEKVELGPRQQDVRYSLLRSDPGDLDYFSVVLRAFDTEDLGLLNPESERLNGVRCFRFYLSHIVAWIRVDSSPLPDPLQELILAPNRPLNLIEQRFAGSREQELMLKLGLADRERRRTAC